MKTLITTLLLAANISLAGDVDSQADGINAQIKVTHDTLQQVLGKLNNRSESNEVYQNPDFVAAAKKFNAKAEQAMIRFEKVMKEEILPQANFYVNRLDSIANSKDYNESQKQSLMDDQKALIQVAFLNLSIKYSEEISKLYNVGLPAATAKMKTKCIFNNNYGQYFQSPKIQINFANPQLKPLNYNLGSSFHASDYVPPIYGCDKPEEEAVDATFNPYVLYSRIWGNTLRTITFEKAIREKCWSSSCITLLGNHLIAYAHMIEDSVNITINFKYGLGITVFRSNPDQLKLYLAPKVEETANLPFDITQSEFERIEKDIIEKELPRRNSQINDLKNSLTTSGVFKKWECPESSVKEIKVNLCNTSIGCLTSQESDDIVRAITKKFPSENESAVRIKCFSEGK